MTATIFEIETRGRAGTRPARVLLEHGVYDRPCELCGARPAALRVCRAELDPQAIERLGEATYVCQYYYCATHRSAAAALYDDFYDAQ